MVVIAISTNTPKNTNHNLNFLEIGLAVDQNGLRKVPAIPRLMTNPFNFHWISHKSSLISVSCCLKNSSGFLSVVVPNPMFGVEKMTLYQSAITPASPKDKLNSRNWKTALKTGF